MLNFINEEDCIL